MERYRSNPFDLEYEYDDGGNRTLKVDNGEDLQVFYTYDLSAPSTYGSKNNRVVATQTYTIATVPMHLFDTWYYYNHAGNVTRIVVGPTEGGGGMYLMGGGGGSGRLESEEFMEAEVLEEGSIESLGGGGGAQAAMGGGCFGNNCPSGKVRFTATRFEYAMNGEALTYAMGESWCAYDDGTAPECPKVTWAREFRYDAGRQRYLDRKLIPSSWSSPSQWVPYADGDTWTDYDPQSDEPYGDTTATSSRSFELGIGRVDPWAGSGTTNSAYYHTDMLGTTRMITGPGGTVVNAPVFTAFGEKIVSTLDGSSNRYGYVGAYGYQAADDMPFLHLGARYYDPSSGRFLQRDPIGIHGGPNVYAYVRLMPTTRTDASGLFGCIANPKPPISQQAPTPAPSNDTVSITVGPPGFNVTITKTEDSWRDLADKQTMPFRIAIACIQAWWNSPPPPPPPPSPPRNDGPYLPGSCFVAGTLVTVPEGQFPIEMMVPGGSVESQNMATGANEYSCVTRVYSGETMDLIDIAIEGEVLTCTAEHPFFVVGRGWTKAGDLDASDRLVAAEEAPVALLSVSCRRLSSPVDVFSLQVGTNADFFVGMRKILVHNKPP